jgi:hypothetical protein
VGRANSQRRWLFLADSWLICWLLSGCYLAVIDDRWIRYNPLEIWHKLLDLLENNSQQKNFSEK